MDLSMDFSTSEIEDVITFWFSSKYETAIEGQKWWFAGKTKDEEIKEKYMDLLRRVEKKEKFASNPKEGLMMILALDQFSRHIYREDISDNKVKRVINDTLALMECERMIELNWDLELPPICRPFVLMPLRHTFKKEYIQKAIDRTMEYLKIDNHPAWLKFLRVSQLKLKAI